MLLTCEVASVLCELHLRILDLIRRIIAKGQLDHDKVESPKKEGEIVMRSKLVAIASDFSLC